jgi:hypothetical protein
MFNSLNEVLTELGTGERDDKPSTASQKVSIYRMAEAKRPAFRKYLEERNVIETINRAMTALNEQSPRPDDPLAFVLDNIGAQPLGPDGNVDALIRENQDLTARVARLEFELAAKTPR